MPKSCWACWRPEEIGISQVLRAATPGMPAGSAAAGAPSVLAPLESFRREIYIAPHPETAATRSKRRAVVAMATRFPNAVTPVHKTWSYIYNWWPQLAVVMCMLVACCVFLHPEVLVIVPMKLASYVPLYIAWAASRMLGHVEHEVAAFFGFGASAWLPAPPLATSISTETVNPSGNSVATYVPRSGSIAPWCLAAFFAWRQH